MSDVMKLCMLRVWLLGIAAIACSCSDDDEHPMAGFTHTVSEVDENVGSDTVVFEFGKELTEPVTLGFYLGGAATIDGDYSIRFLSSVSTAYNSASLSTITVKEGQSTLKMLIDIKDDSYVEPTYEQAYILLESVSDEDIASWIQTENAQYSCIIYDNDNPPDNGLQVDLSWHLGDGVSINEADFDLYLVHNVIINEDDEVDSYENVEEVYSTHEEGFESITIENAFADEEYYLLINYLEGEYDALLTVTMSYEDMYTRVRGVFTTEYVGQSIFYGPITKNGSSYSRINISSPAWRVYP